MDNLLLFKNNILIRQSDHWYATKLSKYSEKNDLFQKLQNKEKRKRTQMKETEQERKRTTTTSFL